MEPWDENIDVCQDRRRSNQSRRLILGTKIAVETLAP